MNYDRLLKEEKCEYLYGTILPHEILQAITQPFRSLPAAEEEILQYTAAAVHSFPAAEPGAVFTGGSFEKRHPVEGALRLL